MFNALNLIHGLHLVYYRAGGLGLNLQTGPTLADHHPSTTRRGSSRRTSTMLSLQELGSQSMRRLRDQDQDNDHREQHFADDHQSLSTRTLSTIALGD